MKKWNNRNSHSFLLGMQTGTATLENSLMVSYKIQHILSYDPAIASLGTYPKELKIHIHPQICTPMFIGALYTIAKMWEQARCPSVGEETNKPWYIQTTEYHSATKTIAIKP